MGSVDTYGEVNRDFEFPESSEVLGTVAGEEGRLQLPKGLRLPVRTHRNHIQGAVLGCVASTPG